MSKRAEHFQVSWHNLNYSIERRPSLLELLQKRISNGLRVTSEVFKISPNSGSYDVKKGRAASGQPSENISIFKLSNGSFKSGQLTAVMGPSGAGKTSLLNLITRRQHVGFSGNLIVSQAKQKRKITINAIAQSDHLPEYLSVRENLTFASRVKNATLSDQEHEKSVATVSKLLGLYECLETRTGRISGGQQKRLAIGQELLSKPDILILDEPTSGLDSLTCFSTLSVLRDLVRASANNLIDPIAIVLTIHQPQREIFELFDKVYVIATQGAVIYDGPPNRCASFVDAHSGLGMPAGYNPASFLIEIASSQMGHKPIDAMESETQRTFSMEQSASLEQASGLEEISPGLYVDPNLVRASNDNGGHFYAKTGALMSRCWIGAMREPNLLLFRLFIHVCMPLALFVVTGHEPGKANACPKLSNQYDLQRMVASDEYMNGERQTEYLLTVENILMLYNVLFTCVITRIGSMSLVFILDMRSSLKEFNNGWYSLNSYLLARVVSDLPVDLILPTITFGLTYWLTGQITGVEDGDLDVIYRILLTSFVTFVGCSIGQMIGMILGAVYLGDVSTALFVSQAVFLPMIMISGLVVRVKDMSPLVSLVSELSLFRHCLDVIYVTRYGFNLCGCIAGSQDTQFVGLANVTMSGVPESFMRLTEHWLADSTELANSGSDNSTKTTNLFRMIAQQVSLYNTYGVDVRCCRELVPFQMYDMGLSESGLIGSFGALVGLHLATVLALVVVVNHVLKRKSNL